MMQQHPGLVAGDPEKQWEWHEAYRDMAKNMYRTSYTDMTHWREVHVKSDFPSGYGGHIPSVRHDVLFRNTGFDRQMTLRRADPSRDAFPSFQEHIAGIPTATRFPSGAKKPPTYGVVPHDGTTTMLRPPFGLLTSKRDPLSHRVPPPTMASTMAQTMSKAPSSPDLVAARRSNEARKPGQLPPLN